MEMCGICSQPQSMLLPYVQRPVWTGTGSDIILQNTDCSIRTKCMRSIFNVMCQIRRYYLKLVVLYKDRKQLDRLTDRQLLCCKVSENVVSLSNHIV
jgi:hypothetical protein